MRWETTVLVTGKLVTVHECITLVMNFAEQKKQCSRDKPISAKIRDDNLLWKQGHEAYILNTKTKRLKVSDGQMIADVKPGSPLWENTSIVD